MQFFMTFTIVLFFMLYCDIITSFKKKNINRKQRNKSIITSILVMILLLVCCIYKHYIIDIIVSIIGFITIKVYLLYIIEDNKHKVESEKYKFIKEIKIKMNSLKSIDGSTYIYYYNQMFLDINKCKTIDELELAKNKCKITIKMLEDLYNKEKSDDSKRIKDITNYNTALNVFGLSSINANAIDIKKKYKELVKKYHPDLGGNKERFIEIQNAYNTLKESYNIK